MVQYIRMLSLRWSSVLRTIAALKKAKRNVETCAGESNIQNRRYFTVKTSSDLSTRKSTEAHQEFAQTVATDKTYAMSKSPSEKMGMFLERPSGRLGIPPTAFLD